MSEDNVRTPSVVELEKNLLKTTWVKEAQLILDYVPEEDLNKSQIKLLEKCVSKEDFTDKQFSDLKLILNKYRFLKLSNPNSESPYILLQRYTMLRSLRQIYSCLVLCLNCL